VVLAKRAAERGPRQGSYWGTLGTAHYRAGDWDAAIAALEKALKLRSGGDSHNWFFLAMAHWQRGDKERARQWFDRAVAWMEKHMPAEEELRRFRAEAAALLGLRDSPPPKGKGPPQVPARGGTSRSLFGGRQEEGGP
jgi:tetratricopeptide (TPR) repeat protein